MDAAGLGAVGQRECRYMAGQGRDHRMRARADKGVAVPNRLLELRSVPTRQHGDGGMRAQLLLHALVDGLQGGRVVLPRCDGLGGAPVFVQRRHMRHQHHSMAAPDHFHGEFGHGLLRGCRGQRAQVQAHHRRARMAPAAGVFGMRGDRPMRLQIHRLRLEGEGRIAGAHEHRCRPQAFQPLRRDRFAHRDGRQRLQMPLHAARHRRPGIEGPDRRSPKHHRYATAARHIRQPGVQGQRGQAVVQGQVVAPDGQHALCPLQGSLKVCILRRKWPAPAGQCGDPAGRTGPLVQQPRHAWGLDETNPSGAMGRPLRRIAGGPGAGHQQLQVRVARLEHRGGGPHDRLTAAIAEALMADQQDLHVERSGVLS